MNTSATPQLIQAHHAAALWLPVALPNSIIRVANLLRRPDLRSLGGSELLFVVARHAIPGDLEISNYDEALLFRNRLGAPDDLQAEAAFWLAFIEAVASYRDRVGL